MLKSILQLIGDLIPTISATPLRPEMINPPQTVSQGFQLLSESATSGMVTGVLIAAGMAIVVILFWKLLKNAISNLKNN